MRRIRIRDLKAQGQATLDQAQAIIAHGDQVIDELEVEGVKARVRLPSSLIDGLQGIARKIPVLGASVADWLEQCRVIEIEVELGDGKIGWTTGGNPGGG